MTKMTGLDIRLENSTEKCYENGMRIHLSLSPFLGALMSLLFVLLAQVAPAEIFYHFKLSKKAAQPSPTPSALSSVPHIKPKTAKVKGVRRLSQPTSSEVSQTAESQNFESKSMVVKEDPAPITVATPVSPAPIEISTHTKAMAIEKQVSEPQWLIQVGASHIADRGGVNSGLSVGLEHSLSSVFGVEASLYGSQPVDGTLGLTTQHQLERFLRGFNFGLQAGLLSSPSDLQRVERNLDFYYGAHLGFAGPFGVLLLSDLKLLADSRYGSARVGLGWRF